MQKTDCAQAGVSCWASPWSAPPAVATTRAARAAPPRTAAGGATTTAAVAAAVPPASSAAASPSPLPALTGENAGLGITDQQRRRAGHRPVQREEPGLQGQLQELTTRRARPGPGPGAGQKLVDDKAVVGIVGPAFSGESKAADPIFNEAGLPIITPSATNADAVDERLEDLPPHAGQRRACRAPASAKYITDTLKAKKVVRHRRRLPTTARAWPTSSRPPSAPLVIGSDTIDPKATDYSATVTKVKAAAPDAVFFGGYYAEAGRLSKQLRDGGVTAQVRLR